MRKNLFHYKLSLLAIAIISALSSCEKNDQPSPIEPIENLYISRLALMDSTGDGLTDTSQVIVFGYDALKRLSTVKVYDHSSGAVVLTGTDTYSYAGSEPYPFKNVYGGPGYSGVSFFEYDGNGMISMDSTIDGSYTYVTMERPISGGVEISSRAYYMGTMNMTVDTVYQTINNNRVVRELYQDAGSDFTVDFQYDNNPNPLKKLNILNHYSLYYFNTTSGFAGTTNNITRIDANGGGMSEHLLSGYTYNNSLPARRYDQTQPGQRGFYYLYSYVTL